ncbi:hypothetical protein AVEN_266909-1 [Araneus ventricosus]|uniref:Transposable element Tc3 transposase n=1 Tax=Araneus ventricosus TaxID=182803 RepID=A0A4Y2DGM6_ARAVE|nr:hypothetical protein AVEN_123976-1 [Araneus ventricosus]GBM15014.1 hypothetical protein AVEN_266909-1 [Araneus ventricosus]
MWQREESNCFNVSGGCGYSIAGSVKQCFGNVQCTVNFSNFRYVFSFLNISTVREILRNILQCYPFKITHVQQLVPADLPKREAFALRFLARMDVDNAWPWNILWTDETHLQGSVNTQNCRIWANREFVPNATIASSFSKGHCVVRVYDSIYSWPFLFRGDWSFGSCNMYSQWDTL